METSPDQARSENTDQSRSNEIRASRPDQIKRDASQQYGTEQKKTPRETKEQLKKNSNVKLTSGFVELQGDVGVEAQTEVVVEHVERQLQHSERDTRIYSQCIDNVCLTYSLDK